MYLDTRGNEIGKKLILKVRVIFDQEGYFSYVKSNLLEVFDFELTRSQILDHCLIILSSFKLTTCVE